MSRLALEELEARCDQLQRNMSSRERANSHSPTRHTFQQQHSRHVTPPIGSSRMPPPPPPGSGGNPTGPGSIPSLPPQPHEIALAMQKLEKEKQRLEDELKQVNTHLIAYRYLLHHQPSLNVSSAQVLREQRHQAAMERQSAGAEPLSSSVAASAMRTAPASSSSYAGAGAGAASTGRAGSASALDSSTIAAGGPGGARDGLRSPVRAGRDLHSPAYRAANLHTPAAMSAVRMSDGSMLDSSATGVVPSALPNDQIAAELARIRRAREEREAQRRLSNAIEANGSPVRF